MRAMPDSHHQPTHPREAEGTSSHDGNFPVRGVELCPSARVGRLSVLRVHGYILVVFQTVPQTMPKLKPIDMDAVYLPVSQKGGTNSALAVRRGDTLSSDGASSGHAVIVLRFSKQSLVEASLCVECRRLVNAHMNRS